VFRLATIAGLCSLSALLCAATACDGAGSRSWAKDKTEDRGGRAEPLQVATTSLRPASIDRHYRTSGTLTARREAQIVATQVGIIRAVAVEEGDHVKPGATLARLDGRELALQADQARVQLHNLQRELDRLESVKLGAISAEEIDKQRYLVEEARVLADLTKVQSKQTIVRAPFEGTIVERFVDEGNLATTATPLFRIADLGALELELFLPERDAATVKRDADVEIELIDGTSFIAKIVRRAPIVDPLTGTVKFTVRATEYPDAAMPGAFARAQVLVDARQNAPSLARSAVFEVEGEPHVFVLVEGKAQRLPVKLGLEGSDRVEILEGLSENDVVVLEGNAGITEGMPLRASASPAGQSSEAS
jgi:membrane fusion protein, multidrug efflux system